MDHGGLWHLDTGSLRNLSQLLLFSFSLLFLPFVPFFLAGKSTLGSLHIFKASFVMVGIRIGVFIVLSNGLKLFFTEGTVEGLQSRRDFGGNCRTAGNRFLGRMSA